VDLQIVGRESIKDSEGQDAVNTLFYDRDSQNYIYGQKGKTTVLNETQLNALLAAPNFKLDETKFTIGDTGIEPVQIDSAPDGLVPADGNFTFLNQMAEQEKKDVAAQNKAAFSEAGLGLLTKQSKQQTGVDLGIAAALALPGIAMTLKKTDIEKDLMSEASQLRKDIDSGEAAKLTREQQQALQRGIAAAGAFAEQAQQESEAIQAAQGVTTSVTSQVAGRQQTDRAIRDQMKDVLDAESRFVLSNASLAQDRLDNINRFLEARQQARRGSIAKSLDAFGRTAGKVRAGKTLKADATLKGLYDYANEADTFIPADKAQKLIRELRLKPRLTPDAVADAISEAGLENELDASDADLINALTRS
tara:strand:+ start:4098 stop:5186 length:1089 start_codon:yes stop_codon:yes gene_type:complete